jgi:Flp pilus assembly protein TadD
MIASLLLAMTFGAPVQAACDGLQPKLRAATDAIEARDLKEAERILDPLRAESQDCGRLLAVLGRFELARRNYVQANTYSELALLRSPDDPEALLFRGQVLAMQGRTDEGRALIERSAKLDPNNAEAHFQLGTIYDRAKLRPLAVAAFEKVIALRPKDPRAYSYLALNLEPMGEIEKAEAAYRKGLQVNEGPRFDRFLDYNYGRLLLKLNRLEESKAHLDRAIELVPKMRATHYDHAKLNMRLGNFQEARQDAERALSIPDPNGFILDLQVYSLLATIYTRLGDEEQARKYIHLSQTTSVPLRSRERK